MGYNTKIDWCDSSWNPVTGCQHDCEYCYARSLANRYGGFDHDEDKNPVDTQFAIGVQELDKPKHIMRKNGLHKAPYPWFFLPTLHRYRLDQPTKWSEPRTIFVCSMADLFGEWVPDEWIQEVFQACENAPWHRYLFLTKNPMRYYELYEKDMMPRGVNAWNKYFGCTITKQTDEYFYNNLYGNGIDHPGFLSIEPIMEDFDIREFDKDEFGIKWIIVGAETGKRKGKVIPKREWIEHLSETCRKSNIPLFMKESLRDLMGDDFRQESPWGGDANER